MTAVSGVGTGIDYTKWIKDDKNVATTNTQTTQQYVAEQQSDQYVSSSGERCTDGKDDGKIGFGSALWNTIKGIGKTAVNMVTGCFTNSEGKFSLGKTLLSIGTAALCIAFPAVGLVACGVGAVAGAVQVGKGVYNAVTADTDAEAKEAWQNVGGGALTTGLSIVGAKASYGAVMKTSTAGASAAGFSKAEIAELQGLGENCSAMGQLGKNASLLSKGSALLKDMGSSTANRAGNIWNSVKSAVPAKNSTTNAASELASVSESAPVAETTTAAEATTAETAAAKETTQGIFSKIRSDLQNLNDMAKLDGGKVSLSDKISVISENLKIEPSELQSIMDSLKLEGFDKTAITNAMNDLMHSKPELIEQYGYDNVLALIEMLAGLRVTDQVV